VNALGQGITISGGDIQGSTDSTETVRFNISNNTMNGTIQGGAININEGVGNGNWQGQVSGNTIGTAATPGSGASQSSDVRVENHSKGTLTAIVNGNTLRQYSVEGITLSAGDTSATGLTNGPLNVTVTSNTVSNPNNNPPTSVPDHGITLIAGTQIGNTNQVCLDLKNNNAAGNPPQGGVDYRVRQRMSTTVFLPGYGGGATDTAAVQAYILARPNTASGSGTASASVSSPPGGGFQNGGAQCTQPIVPTAPETFNDTISGPGGVGIQSASATSSPTMNSGVTSRPFVSPRPAAPPQAAAPTTVVARPTTTVARTAPATTTAPTHTTTSTTTSTVPRRDPVVINGAGGTISVNIGTLNPGDSVTITFQVVIDNPYSGGPNVSNQGTVSGTNFSNVLTDDPSIVGTANPTLTPINSTNIQVNDAKQPEPPSGTAQMLFTLTLSQPASAGGLSVNYATANGGAQPATGGASCDGTSDYITTSGTATVPSGSKTTTIPVTICSDSNVEPDETLLLNISSPSSGTIIDSQATGTITANTAGTFLISELRTSGPGGLGDDFVEFYNNTNSPLTVAASDASAGYGLYKMGADCNATPVLIATIPNGTVIPARGHYLVVGSQYTLANYGGTGAAAGNQTMTSDIESDHNVAVFSTATVDNISSANRLDAVGGDSNTGAVCDLLREGTNLPAVSGTTTEHSFFRKECDFVSGVGCAVAGNPKDTNDNNADFMFADTQGTFISGVPQHLGAPGPERSSSPIRRDTSGIGLPLLDATVSSTNSPNRVRDLTSNPGNNSTFGTLSIRRRVTNSTGATVTRLRFRIIELTTFPSPGGGVADLRAITSSPVVISGINDPGTCASTGTPTTTPCQVTAQATVLEQPPTQPNGGGYNSTVSLTLPGPGLANNASIDVNFTLGVQTTGTFRFYIIIEALP
jgi:hypothetical protein